MKQNVIFAGIKGTIVAIDRSTGKDLWRAHLKGSDFVNLILDGENLYATTKGEIFCLDPATGTLRWHNRMQGLGYGLITVATPVGSQTVIAEQKRQETQRKAAV